jgi:hypothetical protein
MADALCGPSNALQNFQKHTTIDRTLQQDRLISRQSPPQVKNCLRLYTLISSGPLTVYTGLSIRTESKCRHIGPRIRGLSSGALRPATTRLPPPPTTPIPSRTSSTIRNSSSSSRWLGLRFPTLTHLFPAALNIAAEPALSAAGLRVVMAPRFPEATGACRRAAEIPKSCSEYVWGDEWI